MNTPFPDCTILGMGYLGRPLAEKCYQQGSEVAATKRSLTSDDINLPIQLDSLDLNQADAFDAPFWEAHWRNKPTWFCLLPPTPFADYTAVLRQWREKAEAYGVQHLIFSSSTGVYGDQARACDETTPPDPQTESARRIVAVEQDLLSSSVPNIDILRFGGLYCAERHPLRSLLKKSQISGGSQPVNVIHRDAAVAALLQTAAQPKGKRIRNVVESEHPTRAEFYRAEARKLGLPEPDFLPDDTRGGKIVNSISETGLSL